MRTGGHIGEKQEYVWAPKKIQLKMWMKECYKTEKASNGGWKRYFENLVSGKSESGTTVMCTTITDGDDKNVWTRGYKKERSDECYWKLEDCNGVDEITNVIMKYDWETVVAWMEEACTK